jgi:drug/metabolite transporter (DMT)-like permease
MTFSITGSIILAILGNMSLINIKFLFYLLIILVILLILSYVFYNKSIKKWSALEF